MTQWDIRRDLERLKKKLEWQKQLADARAKSGPLFEALRTRSFGRALRIWFSELLDMMLTHVVSVLTVGVIGVAIFAAASVVPKNFVEEHPGILIVLFLSLFPIVFVFAYRLSKPGQLALIVLTDQRANIFRCKLICTKPRKQFQLVPTLAMVVNFRVSSSDSGDMKLADKWTEEVKSITGGEELRPRIQSPINTAAI